MILQRKSTKEVGEAVENTRLLWPYFLKYPIASFREFLSPLKLFIKRRLPRRSILRVLHTYNKWNFAIIILNENYNFVRFLNFEERLSKRDHSKLIYNHLKSSLLFKSSASAILCLQFHSLKSLKLITNHFFLIYMLSIWAVWIKKALLILLINFMHEEVQ